MTSICVLIAVGRRTRSAPSSIGRGSRPSARRGQRVRGGAMSIQALGYVGVRAKSLEDWASFGETFLGMQLVDKSRSGLAFRMDDRKQRLVVAEDGGEGVAFFGWEGADKAALDAFAARLGEARRAGVPPPPPP